MWLPGKASRGCAAGRKGMPSRGMSVRGMPGRVVPLDMEDGPRADPCGPGPASTGPAPGSPSALSEEGGRGDSLAEGPLWWKLGTSVLGSGRVLGRAMYLILPFPRCSLTHSHHSLSLPQLFIGIRMTPEMPKGEADVRTEDEDSESSIEVETPRGLSIALGWQFEVGRGKNNPHWERGTVIISLFPRQENSLLLMERDYNSAGELKEVRSRTAVKGAWAGGRM